MLDYLVRALLVVRKQLLETTGVGLVHEAGTARAGVALDLAVLVAEVVGAFGRVPLEALRRLAKALGRGPVGFQLGHRLKLLNFVTVAPVARRLSETPATGERPQVDRLPG